MNTNNKSDNKIVQLGSVQLKPYNNILNLTFTFSKIYSFLQTASVQEQSKEFKFLN